MSNLFDEEVGHQLTMKAIRMLERPAEIQREDDPFTLNASLCTKIHIVKSEEDYQSQKFLTFQPDYMHQIFRENNEIYGYKDLKILIYISALRLTPYIKISYTELTEDADNLEEGLKKLYNNGYLQSEPEFIEQLRQEQNLSPLGKQVMQYDNFSIYLNTINSLGFIGYKENLQAFLLLLIDGASYPCDAENWIYYTLYQDNVFVGLTTVYSFEITSTLERHRLSQMLILPQFQKQGHGSKMLQAVYAECAQNPRCVQITLEDPSDDFQVMRDVTDCKLLRPYFDDVIAKRIISQPADLPILTQQRLIEIMRKTKLYSEQIKKAFYIYVYAHVNKKSHNTMVAYTKVLINNMQKDIQAVKRMKNILIKFEDGSSPDSRQLHLLELKEKEDQNVDYEEILSEEICFYEMVAQKLRKDKII